VDPDKPGRPRNDRTHRNRRTTQPLTPDLDNGPGSDKQHCEASRLLLRPTRERMRRLSTRLPSWRKRCCRQRRAGRRRCATRGRASGPGRQTAWAKVPIRFHGFGSTTTGPATRGRCASGRGPTSGSSGAEERAGQSTSELVATRLEAGHEAPERRTGVLLPSSRPVKSGHPLAGQVRVAAGYLPGHARRESFGEEGRRALPAGAMLGGAVRSRGRGCFDRRRLGWDFGQGRGCRQAWARRSDDRNRRRGQHGARAERSLRICATEPGHHGS
jgi:hypothetical protein